METIQYIYKLTNLANGKSYVGITEHPCLRERQHFNLLKSRKHPNRRLQSDFNRYGEKVFSYQLIDVFTGCKARNNFERKWIARLKTFTEVDGYNEKDIASILYVKLGFMPDCKTS